jgi:TRAP-type C4-dicarboxylate transport system permease small subunit
MADDIDMAALDAAAGPKPFDPVRLLLDALAAIGTIWTFGLMCLICADVIGRSFLNAPITGVAEIAAHSVVGIVFLQIGATIYSRRMTRADFLIDRLHRGMPGLARLIEIAFMLVGAAIMFFIAQSAWPGVWNSLAAREFFGVQGIFTVPTWPFRALIVLGGVAGGLAYLVLVVHEALALRRPVRS